MRFTKKKIVEEEIRCVLGLFLDGTEVDFRNAVAGILRVTDRGMKYKKIIKRLKRDEINAEEALEALSGIGFCPNLLNDDNGHWAVSFDGFQNLSHGDEPEDISLTAFVEAGNWKDTIREALLYSLEKDGDVG